MSREERSRRKFLRTAIGGTLALPALLRAQVPTTPSDSSHIDESDFIEYRDSIPYLQSRRGQPVSRRHKKPSDPPPLLKPPMLTEGATIGLVAPASGVARKDLVDAVSRLRELGFKVKQGEELTKGFGYLAGTDEQRADEFMKFVHDPEVSCIMAVRGGYGVMRILPRLDFEEIRKNPKIIIGYSDITALLNTVFQQSRMISFHGPVATSTFDKYTLDSFRRTLMTATPAGEFSESEEFNGSVFSEKKAQTLVKGKAQGRLVGGNLSLVVALMGTPYEIATAGNILFLEEVEEEPYRVDRMLTQLALSGKLSACTGIALGRFSKCEAKSGSDASYKLSLSLEQVIRGIVEPLNIPTVYGLAIGHIKSKMTVPVGALATLDADAKTLKIDEAAVV